MTATMLATVSAPEPDDDEVSAALATPPAPLPTRTRRRPPQPGNPASAAPSVAVVLSVPERNRTVLRMHLEGKTFDQIGAHFGRCRRTIASWYGEAKREQAKTFRKNTAEDIAAEIESKFAASYARWLAILERAQATGNLKLEITALARMDQSQVHRVKALQGIGYFDHVQFKPDTDDQEDSVTRSRGFLNYFHAMSAHEMSKGTAHADSFPDPDLDEFMGQGARNEQDEPAY